MEIMNLNAWKNFPNKVRKLTRSILLAVSRIVSGTVVTENWGNRLDRNAKLKTYKNCLRLRGLDSNRARWPRLGILQRKILRRIFVPVRNVSGTWRIGTNNEHNTLIEAAYVGRSMWIKWLTHMMWSSYWSESRWVGELEGNQENDSITMLKRICEGWNIRRGITEKADSHRVVLPRRINVWYTATLEYASLWRYLIYLISILKRLGTTTEGLVDRMWPTARGL